MAPGTRLGGGGAGRLVLRLQASRCRPRISTVWRFGAPLALATADRACALGHRLLRLLKR